MSELERFIKNTLIDWRQSSEAELTACTMGMEELENRIKSLGARQLQTEAHLEELQNSFTSLESLLRHLNNVLQQN
jgi:chromosome segregation ATPase